MTTTRTFESTLESVSGARIHGKVPVVDRNLFAWFAWYGRRYLRRNFHAVRIRGRQAAEGAQGPVLVVANHPSWWDPLVFVVLARQLWPNRTNYGPMDSAALAKYRFFERMGFFGIEPGTHGGGRAFMEVGQAVLNRNDSALWITAQGRFVDVRHRPPMLRSGVSRLLARVEKVTVLPLALEYVFWNERLPEVLLEWGEPWTLDRARDMATDSTAERDADGLHAEVTERLLTTQQSLARCSMARDGTAFETLLLGGVGVGGAYDIWRRTKALLTGREFVAAHEGESGTDPLL